VPRICSDGPGFVRRPPSEHADTPRPLDRWGTGTRAQRFLAPTSYRVIRDALITPVASVRLEDVAKRIP